MTIVQQGKDSSRQRWMEWVILGLALLMLVVAYGPHLAHTSDDGYITYRYARNLADGHGLVFNPGEQHLGTTGPGLAAVLGTVGFFSTTAWIPTASGALALLALIGSLALLARRLSPDSWRLTWAVSLFLACNRWLIEVLGHEVFVALLLALVALELACLGRFWRSGISWGLACFMRPDIAVMGGVAGISQWLKSRRFPSHLLFGFLVTIGLFGLLLLWLAGEVIPFSLQVKRAEGSASVLAVGAPFLQTVAAWTQRTWSWGAFPLLVLAAAGLPEVVRRTRRRAREFAIPALAMLLFYPLVGVPAAPWYFVIPIVAIIALAATAASKAILYASPPLKALAIILLIASVTPTAIWWQQLGFNPPDPRAQPMRAAAAWIGGHPGIEGSAATVEVGFFSFATERQVLDIIGLGSPGALEALTSSGLADFFLEHDPAFLVDNPTFHYLLEPLLTDLRFLERYETVHTIPADRRYPVPITIWQRKTRD